MKNFHNKDKLYEKGLNFLLKKDYLSAKKSFEKILKLDSFNKEAMNSLGVIYRILNNYDLSINYFKLALSQDQNYSDALNNLSDIYYFSGKRTNALITHLRLLEIDSDNENNLVKLTKILKNTQLTKFNPYLDKYLTLLFEKKISVDVSDISNLLISLIKLNPTFIECIELLKSKGLKIEVNDLCNYIKKLKLLVEVMHYIEIEDFEVEFFLTTVRKIILCNLKKIKAFKFLENFLCSLSINCFKNEYIFSVTKEEDDELLKIEKNIQRKLLNQDKISDLEILILSAYKRLVEYKWHPQIIEFKYPIIHKVQIADFIEEQSIRSIIKEKGLINDKISMEMKDQYELYPYPRWTQKKFEKSDITLRDYCDNLKLLVNRHNNINKNDLKILVAGCGTGKQSINLSFLFPKSQILAIDLSKSSLAYAMRETKELNINNIDYLCMDILNVNLLKESFDYISCAGVLHHMKDPVLGWKRLLKCLNKKGLLEIALYSKSARTDILKIRRDYKIKKGIFNITDLRRIRQRIINDNKDVSRTNIIYSKDFFSLSGFKDLFVNENEIQYEISEIKEILNDLDLSFCGFQLNDYQTRILRKEKITDISLKQLSLIEKKHPHFFGGMYHFWCQKIS